MKKYLTTILACSLGLAPSGLAQDANQTQTDNQPASREQAQDRDAVRNAPVRRPAEQQPAQTEEPDPDPRAPDRGTNQVQQAVVDENDRVETPAAQPDSNSGAETPENRAPAGNLGQRPPSSGYRISRTLTPPSATKAPSVNPEGQLRLNFRGVPLEMVLNYLSEAAGFIIVLETDVKGKVDVWSNQPLNKKEAVDLLNTVLNQNGYAAIQNGRTLTVVSRDAAKTRDIPVKTGADPQKIAKSDAMVTQILPIRYISAEQLLKDLQPLLNTTYANLTANQGGNSLVLTDTQANVRRIAEIVKALDQSNLSAAQIKVFPLRYADSKELATAVKDLFTPPQQGNAGGNGQNPFGFRFGGGRPGGGQGGGGAAPAAANPVNNANRVQTVADERTNSLIVSAPDDVMPLIERLIHEIDVNTTDITELRVFRLRNADPVEMASLFLELFPDDTSNDANNRGGFRFGGGFGRRFGAQPQDASSDRLKKKGRVLAVADARTASIIISAASEMMPQIEEMVAQLDSSPAKKQKVFVYSLENADVQQVETVLRDMFERTTTANRSSQNDTSALVNRRNQNQNNQTSGLGTSGLNSSGLGGGQGLFR
jgi:type II secretory pathway component GspD/PulD (secretin)